MSLSPNCGPIELFLQPEAVDTNEAGPLSNICVFGVGSNFAGALGLGPDVDDVESMRPIERHLAGKNVMQIIAGGMHSVFLTANGQVILEEFMILFT